MPAQAVRPAERGLGGTGLHFGTTLEGDRGIGGTGAPPKAVRRADRGIGGTGIVARAAGRGHAAGQRGEDQGVTARAQVQFGSRDSGVSR